MTTAPISATGLTKRYKRRGALALDHVDLEVREAYYYYLGGNPVQNSFDWSGLGVLAAIAVILMIISVLGLRRRDIAA